jgi:hypothetical protein
MSDAAVEQRRALIMRKKKERIEAQPPGVQGLTEEQRMLIAELMDAQMKTFDTTFSQFKDFRVGGLGQAAQYPSVLPRASQYVSGPRDGRRPWKLVRNANFQASSPPSQKLRDGLRDPW